MKQNKNIVRIALVTALLLMIPLTAMQFTTEVNWTLFDFIFAGVLIFGTGLAYEFLSRKSDRSAYRFGAGIALLGAFALIWINGAVGIIGNENNPANLLYFGVLIVLFIGSLVARFRSHGMARTLFATAFVQFLVPVIALLIWKPGFSPGVVGVFILNAFFVALFAGSAILFQRASAVSSDSSR